MKNRCSAEALAAVRRLGVGLVLPACLAGCLADGEGPGPLVGPSALALSIRLRATPDVLPIDGAARAVIDVTAAGPDGAPAADLRLTIRIADGSTAHNAGAALHPLHRDGRGRACGLLLPCAAALRQPGRRGRSRSRGHADRCADDGRFLERGWPAGAYSARTRRRGDATLRRAARLRGHAGGAGRLRPGAVQRRAVSRPRIRQRPGAPAILTV